MPWTLDPHVCQSVGSVRAHLWMRIDPSQRIAFHCFLPQCAAASSSESLSRGLGMVAGWDSTSAVASASVLGLSAGFSMSRMGQTLVSILCCKYLRRSARAGDSEKSQARARRESEEMPWRGEGKKERERERERGDSLDDGHDEHAAHGEDHWPLLVGLVPLGVFKVLVRQERERERGEKESQSGSPLGEGG